MTKALKQMMQLGGMLTIVLGATAYHPLKASAQSLLPDINILEGGQVCLALCNSPKPTDPSQALPSGLPGSSNPGIGGLPAQIMQLPGQVLQLPQQILSPQGSQVSGSSTPIPSGVPPQGLPPGTPLGVPQGLPPGAPPQGLPPGPPQGLPPGAPQGLPQSSQQLPPQAPPQAPRTSFLQKIAPVLPILIQRFSQ